MIDVAKTADGERPCSELYSRAVWHLLDDEFYGFGGTLLHPASADDFEEWQQKIIAKREWVKGLEDRCLQEAYTEELDRYQDRLNDHRQSLEKHRNLTEFMKEHGLARKERPWGDHMYLEAVSRVLSPEFKGIYTADADSLAEWQERIASKRQWVDATQKNRYTHAAYIYWLDHYQEQIGKRREKLEEERKLEAFMREHGIGVESN